MKRFKQFLLIFFLILGKGISNSGLNSKNLINKIENLFSKFDFSDKDDVIDSNSDFGLGLDLKKIENESLQLKEIDLQNFVIDQFPNKTNL